MSRAALVINGVTVASKEVGTGSISDGYHTFDELYCHRNLLFLALMTALFWSRRQNRLWVSKLHADGTMFEGHFIAGIDLPQAGVGPITYHLPLSMWELLDPGIQVLDRAPAWDGHTPDDVLWRLAEYIKPGSTIKKRQPRKVRSMWPKLTLPKK